MTHVTVPAEDPVAQFTTTTASAGPFNFSFTYFSAGELQVFVNNTEIDAADYTLTPSVTAEGGYDGGSVTLDTAVASSTVTIRRNTTIERTTDIPNSGAFPIAALNTTLDKLFGILQELNERLTRTIRYPAGDTGTVADGELDPAADMASKYLAFDANGLPIPAASITSTALSALATTLAGITTVSAHLDALGFSTLAKNLADDTTLGAFLTTLGIPAFIQTLLDDTDAATARATLKIPLRMFVADRNGVNQTGIADGVWTQLELGTERLDTHGCYDTATYRYTPGVAGWTLFIARAAWNTTDDAAQLGVAVYINGGNPASGSSVMSSASSTTGLQGPLYVGLLQHDADDYFEMRVLNDGTGTEDVHGSVNQTFFAGITIYAT